MRILVVEDERKVAEALSYALLHCGGPTMVQAMDVWLKMVKQGRVPMPYDQKPST